MTEYARLWVIRLSNYKLEVENTEKLKEDINSAFSEINAELKKDDNLIASDLFDVDRCIEELKKSRKKWASGTGGVSISGDTWRNISLNLSGLQFNPTIVLCVMISDNGTELEWTPIINSKNYYIKPRYSDSRAWDLTEMMISSNSEHNKDNITVMRTISYSNEFAKNLTWYAFE